MLSHYYFQYTSASCIVTERRSIRQLKDGKIELKLIDRLINYDKNINYGKKTIKIKKKECVLKTARQK
jgi:hypothetical protein